MKVLLFVIGLCIGASQSFELMFDIEACATLPDVPTPRVLNASRPIFIDSPGYNISDPEGSQYPFNTTCEWQIFIDDPNIDSLEIDFIAFDLVSSMDCANDRFDVFDGVDDTGVLLDTFCGNQVNSISVTSKNLFLRFVSDDFLTEKGFAARLGYPFENSACEAGGQIYTQDQGLISSLNYPSFYENDLTCTYMFDVPAGMRLDLEFLSFDLAQNCNDDVVEFWDGDPKFTPGAIKVLTSYGNEQLPPRILSGDGDQVYMEFTSDNTGVATGFLAAYQFVPA